jgi:drug/metabolite transporter, DME family
MTPERKGMLSVLAAALLWSTGGIGIKAVDAGPIVVACLRSAIAFVALVPIFRPRIRRVTPAFVVALVSYAACLTTFVIATKWTTAANAIFIQYGGGVVLVMLLSPVVLKEHLRQSDVVTIAIALCGMALFFRGQFDSSGMAGNLVALLSAGFFAAIVLALRLERDNAAEAAVTYGNLLAALALLPFAWRDISVSRASAGILVFLGVFQIAFAYAFFVNGLKRVRATTASLIGMAEPVLNPIWVFLALGERPGPYALLGGAVVVAAIGYRAIGGRE